MISLCCSNHEDIHTFVRSLSIHREIVFLVARRSKISTTSDFNGLRHQNERGYRAEAYVQNLPLNFSNCPSQSIDILKIYVLLFSFTQRNTAFVRALLSTTGDGEKSHVFG